MISLKSVSKSYDDLLAVRCVSFEVDRGEIIGLVGPNGAGKTTIMKMITGFILPNSGTVEVDGIDVASNPTDAQKRIGYLPENNPLYPEMTVQDYLVFSGEMRGLAGAPLLERLTFCVDACGLREVLVRPIRQLSKGFRQRVGIAAAIIHDPDILILDEPTSGLDPNQIVEIRSLIHELGRDKTVILSTHILSEVEETCTRAIMIVGGEKGADDSIDELLGGQSMRMIFDDATPEVLAAAREEISGVDGVETVESLHDMAGFRITPKSGSSIGNALFALARQESWPVSEIAVNRRSLEDVFREVTLAASQGGES
jgi:ABC-2 type transport system ATP-binding protein